MYTYDAKDFLTFDEAFEFYFKDLLGRNKLRDMVRQKLVPVVDLPTKKTIFSKVAIEAWLKEKATPKETEQMTIMGGNGVINRQLK